MTITFWGTRGSISTFGPGTVKYGGNTPCVSILLDDSLLILDAGSGIRKLGEKMMQRPIANVHLLLTHLHMDHIQGLGFFKPFFSAKTKISIWGPGGNSTLDKRLNRYLSPPLFPVRIRDFACELEFKETPLKPFQIGPFMIQADYICHPGPTLGYRISDGKSVVAFIPDHEPALGASDFPNNAEWTSGFQLAKEADVLIHDAQFSDEEYAIRVGWGHSSYRHTLQFAKLANVKMLQLFHHDPGHTDQDLDQLYWQYVDNQADFPVEIAQEGTSLELM